MFVLSNLTLLRWFLEEQIGKGSEGCVCSVCVSLLLSIATVPGLAEEVEMQACS